MVYEFTIMFINFNLYYIESIIHNLYGTYGLLFPLFCRVCFILLWNMNWWVCMKCLKKRMLAYLNICMSVCELKYKTCLYRSIKEYRFKILNVRTCENMITWAETFV